LSQVSDRALPAAEKVTLLKHAREREDMAISKVRQLVTKLI